MLQTYKKNNAGFTLIEMMVSLALFTIVITITTGSFLVLLAGNSRVQGEQSVMTTLTFALDSMTREIRTGVNYYCLSNDTFGGQESLASSTRDCSSGAGNNNAHGLSFMEAGSSITGSSNRIAYYFENTGHTLFRRVGSNQPQSIVSDAINLQSVDFFVTGSTPQSAGTDANQPAVTIVIKATDPNDTTGKVFTLQTTVTQRELDL